MTKLIISQVSGFYMSSSDEVSIPVIWNNITGSNFEPTEKREYMHYLRFLKKEGANLNEDFIFSQEYRGITTELGRKKASVQVKKWEHDTNRIIKANMFRLFRKNHQYLIGPVGYRFLPDVLDEIINFVKEHMPENITWAKTYGMEYLNFYTSGNKKRAYF